jgi:hypothetical protein
MTPSGKDNEDRNVDRPTEILAPTELASWHISQTLGPTLELGLLQCWTL